MEGAADSPYPPPRREMTKERRRFLDRLGPPQPDANTLCILGYNITTVVGLSNAQSALHLPQAPQPESRDGVEPRPADTSNVIQRHAQARRWRNVEASATPIPAALLPMFAVRVYQPYLLPAGIRP